jgi:hypothetical protein
MVDSTTMNLELVGEFLSYLQNFKDLPHGFSCVIENKIEVSLSIYSWTQCAPFYYSFVNQMI